MGPNKLSLNFLWHAFLRAGRYYTRIHTLYLIDKSILYIYIFFLRGECNKKKVYQVPLHKMFIIEHFKRSRASEDVGR